MIKMEINVLSYFNITYFVVVMFGLQAMKKLVPMVWEKIPAKWITVMFGLFIAVILFFLETHGWPVKEKADYIVKILVSFFMTVGCYEMVYKPFAKFFEPVKPQE